MTTEAIFSNLYATAWCGTSGHGSREEYTREYRAFLHGFMRARGVTSVVDIGSGDWEIGRLIDWGGIDYTGIEAVRGVMERTKAHFEKPGVRFSHGDALAMDLPPAEMAIVKDVLQHLSNADIARLWGRLTSTYPTVLVINDCSPHGEPNVDVPTGGCRGLELAKPPFSFQVQRLLRFHDKVVEMADRR